MSTDLPTPDDRGSYTVPPGVLGVEGSPEEFERVAAAIADLPATQTLVSEDRTTEIRFFRWPEGQPYPDREPGQRLMDGVDLFVLPAGVTISLAGTRDPADAPPKYRRLVESAAPLLARQLPELRQAMLTAYRNRPDGGGELLAAPDRLLGGEKAVRGYPGYPQWVRRHGAELGQALKGDCYWIAEEMVDVAETAGAALDGCGFDATDLPSLHGNMLLDKAMTLTVVAPRTEEPGRVAVMEIPDMRVLLCWSAAQDAVHFSVHIDRNAYADFMAMVGRVDSLDALIEMVDRLPPFVVLGYGAVRCAPDATDGADSVTITGFSHEQAARWFPLFRAVCALVQQPVTSVRSEYAARAVQRRLMRAGDPQGGEPVRVITLRRPDGGGAGSTAHLYRHRWIVRGHWRRQSCGPGGRERRPVWVMPHVKGPDGAPLLGGEKVYALRR